ncbi:MAG TPA: response regulator [Polyangiaceae bacterium]|nr:response regulator [Polyangiaceae bacterium]
MDGGVSKEHVLVVDDEPQILVALEDLLGDDFTILKSHTPEGALAFVENDPNIAVVITDQRMPRMTGDELLQRMTGMNAVGIMVSGFADLPAVIRAINEGKVFAYVTKPWDADDLRFKVAKGVEHFRLARQIAHERQLLADLMSSSPDGIFFKGKDLKFQRVNRSFAEAVGLSTPEALIGRRVSDGLLPVELAARVEAEESELLRVGEPSIDLVREYRGKNGSEWYSESKAPIRGPDGEIDGLVAISRNVTERLRTQEALRKSEERLRQQSRILNSILDGIGEGVIVVDSGGRTLLFNTEAQRVLGAQARDVPPEQWAAAYGVYLADGRTVVPPAENPLVRAMHGSRKVEMEVIIKNGGVPEARVAIVATPLRADSGEVSGAIALLRDVTQKRSLEQLLVHSQKMEAVGQLAGGVAHDFNNLLAVIEGSGEMALEELAGHTAREDVVDMVTAAKRAASLTRQLLAFSRREAARPEPIQLGSVVHGVEKMLRRLIGEHITLLTKLEAVSPVMADSNQLEQVLINLCVNARDAMPEGGTLRIELSALKPDDPMSLPDMDSVVLKVSDTGSGMDTEVLKRIFEPFFTTKEIGKGTGLGLSMVYGIVTQNGGQISVESSVGRGTTFTIVFPVTSLDQTHAHTSAPPRHGPTGGGTILLVEDDPSVRHITARILRRHGYLVVEAGKPSEARAISEAGDAIDLLLTDLVMPEMTGVKLADELTLARPGLRVLYMTGYAGAALNAAQSDLLDPEERVIQKPFTSDALLDRVRAALLTPARAGIE